jgi:site-specific DNA recombinase
MDGRNLAGQLDMCREYAERQGWQIVAELAEDERGVSGARMDAPQLTRAIDMAAAGQYDVLVVREIDRLARDVGKQYIVEGELKRCKVKIAYVLGEYPDTPEGDLQKAIKAAIAGYERTKITERSVRGRRREASRGSTLVHGKPPYGYDVIHDGDKYQLVINEAQAEVVRLIYQWYTGPERIPGRSICTRLNEAGIAAPRGGQWRHGQLRRILSSETYCGRWYYGKFNGHKGQSVNDPAEWIAVNVPAIVDRATWAQAQERGRVNKELAARNLGEEYLLRGRVKCGACGRRMGRMKSGKNRYAYYRCDVAAFSKIAVDRCDHNTTYRQDVVDAITWDWVMQLICAPDALKDGWQRYQAAVEADTAPLRSQLSIVEEGIAKHKDQLAKVLDLYLSDVIDKGMLLERQERLQSVLDSLSARRDELQTNLRGRAVTKDEFISLQSFVGDLAERLDLGSYEGDIERMRQVIDMLDVRATLAFENGQRVLYLTCRLDSGAFIVNQSTNSSAPTPACSTASTSGSTNCEPTKCARPTTRRPASGRRARRASKASAA